MANIDPVKTSGTNEVLQYTWEQINNDDTPTELAWPGGPCYVEVKGTFDSAVVQLQYGLTSGGTVDLSTEEAPTGAKFSAARMIKLDLPSVPGFILPTDSGGGGSQDIDIVLVKAGNTKS